MNGADELPHDPESSGASAFPAHLEAPLKLLLTSGGVTNASIRSALVRLLGRPVDECRALCIPTAQWGHPMCNSTSVRGFAAAEPRWQYSSGLGWGSLGVLELTALPTIGAERYVPWIREADVLLVDGGDATYLCHWIRESGLVDLLPSLSDTVWVGVSAGSMVMTPRIGSYFVEWPSAPDDRTLGVVDFSVFPNLVDGTVEVISEGRWRKFGAWARGQEPSSPYAGRPCRHSYVPGDVSITSWGYAPRTRAR